MSRFRSSQSTGGATKKALILVDSLAHQLVDIHQIPLVVIYDVPKPEAYAQLVASAASASFQRPGIVVTVATSDEDIDKLRRIEALFRIRVQPIPTSLFA